MRLSNQIELPDKFPSWLSQPCIYRGERRASTRPDFMAIFSDEQTLARARRKRDSIVEFHVGLDEFNIAPPSNKDRAKIEVAFIRVIIIIIITIAVRARGSRSRFDQ